MSITYEAHHIFPEELYHTYKELFDEIKNSGIALPEQQAFDNRIMLFKDPSMAAAIKSQLAADPNAFGNIQVGGLYHNGYHRNYNKALDIQLRRIADLDTSLEAKATMIWNLHQAATKMIRSGEHSLYADPLDTSQERQDKHLNQLKKYFNEQVDIRADLDLDSERVQLINDVASRFDHQIFDPRKDGTKGSNDAFIAETFKRFLQHGDQHSDAYSTPESTPGNATTEKIARLNEKMNARAEILQKEKGLSLEEAKTYALLEKIYPNPTDKNPNNMKNLIGEVRNALGSAPYMTEHLNRVRLIEPRI